MCDKFYVMLSHYQRFIELLIVFDVRLLIKIIQGLNYAWNIFFYV